MGRERRRHRMGTGSKMPSQWRLLLNYTKNQRLSHLSTVTILWLVLRITRLIANQQMAIEYTWISCNEWACPIVLTQHSSHVHFRTSERVQKYWKRSTQSVFSMHTDCALQYLLKRSSASLFSVLREWWTCYPTSSDFKADKALKGLLL